MEVLDVEEGRQLTDGIIEDETRVTPWRVLAWGDEQEMDSDCVICPFSTSYLSNCCLCWIQGKACDIERDQ
jgi:hypothetical protein